MGEVVARSLARLERDSSRLATRGVAAATDRRGMHAEAGLLQLDGARRRRLGSAAAAPAPSPIGAGAGDRHPADSGAEQRVREVERAEREDGAWLERERPRRLRHRGDHGVSGGAAVGSLDKVDARAEWRQSNLPAARRQV